MDLLKHSSFKSKSGYAVFLTAVQMFPPDREFIMAEAMVVYIHKLILGVQHRLSLRWCLQGWEVVLWGGMLLNFVFIFPFMISLANPLHAK